jgi:hypothetical protein
VTVAAALYVIWFVLPAATIDGHDLDYLRQYHQLSQLFVRSFAVFV